MAGPIKVCFSVKPHIYLEVVWGYLSFLYNPLEARARPACINKPQEHAHYIFVIQYSYSSSLCVPNFHRIPPTVND